MREKDDFKAQLSQSSFRVGRSSDSVSSPAAHALNRGATVSSSLAIALEAGILLGAAYAATQRLWVPIGLHIGWNFTEGSIFSMSVSGNSLRAGLIRGSLSGPRILTGGQFGPEASIVAVIVCLAAALFFIRRIAALHGAEPPAWRRLSGTRLKVSDRRPYRLRNRSGSSRSSLDRTWHLWNGVDLRTIQTWLGHSDMESTMRYLKPARSQAVRDKVDSTQDRLDSLVIATWE